MNLPEYFSMVLDQTEVKYVDTIARYEGSPLQRNARDEALKRLKEIEALRKVLTIHNTWKVVHSQPNILSEGCEGCGLDTWEDLMTPNVNDCPTLLALIEPYSDRADFGSWS
jgi:hypothetical protein